MKKKGKIMASKRVIISIFMFIFVLFLFYMFVYLVFCLLCHSEFSLIVERSSTRGGTLYPSSTMRTTIKLLPRIFITPNNIFPYIYKENKRNQAKKKQEDER